MSNVARTLIMLASVSASPLVAAPARANEDSIAGDRGKANGKAAAHAALADKAELPAMPPQLPEQAFDKVRAAAGKTALGAKADAARRAHVQGQQQAGQDAKAAHLDAADRAAQGSVASAVRNANADSHAAAGQARAAAAKAKAAEHPHPNPVSHP